MAGLQYVLKNATRCALLDNFKMRTLSSKIEAQLNKLTTRELIDFYSFALNFNKSNKLTNKKICTTCGQYINKTKKVDN